MRSPGDQFCCRLHSRSAVAFVCTAAVDVDGVEPLANSGAARDNGHAAMRIGTPEVPFAVHPLPHGKLAGLVFASARAYLVCMNDVARTLFLVCYDIGSPKRLHRVHKYLLGYRVGGQKSFFECWLTPAELREVRQTLETLLEPTQDRAHIFQLDPRMKNDGLGLAKQPVTNVFMIV